MNKAVDKKPVIKKQAKKVPVKGASKSDDIKKDKDVVSEAKKVTDKKVTDKKVTDKKVADKKVTDKKVEETEEDVEEPKIVSTRTAPTRESIINSFDVIMGMVDSEIESLREGSTKSKGVRFLRTLNKNIKVLKTQSMRVIKVKKAPSVKANTNSGFLKPVSISGDMAKFTGWDPKELRSRVEVTKYICDYIKEHNLQDPADRRQIKPDDKLQKLLGYTEGDDVQPLRYYSLQTHLKQHFPKKD